MVSINDLIEDLTETKSNDGFSSTITLPIIETAEKGSDLDIQIPEDVLLENIYGCLYSLSFAY